MVETLEEAKRRGEHDIPPIGVRKNVYYTPEWGDKFGYPINKIPVADYYVEYNYNHNNFGSRYLIEASKSHLRAQILQIEETAEFFRNNEIPVDTYLVVIDKLSDRDNKKYKLKDFTFKPFKQVFEKIDYTNEKAYLVCKKPLFVIFRKDFDRLRK